MHAARSTVMVLVLLAAGAAARADSVGGSATVSTHVFDTIGAIENRDSGPVTSFVGPLQRQDAVVESVHNGPPNHAYASASASAAWLPGSVKAAATARIDGLCLPNGSGGCEGPGTVRTGATASATLLAIADPGLSAPQGVQNNLQLSGAITRVASFLSSQTQALYADGTIADATASFSYSLRQYRYNPDAGHDVPVLLANGSLKLTSRYDGQLAVESSGWLNAVTSWDGSPLMLTTPSFILQPGKDVEVQFGVAIDTAYLYSLRAADRVVSSLAFGSTWGFSTDPSAPAFSGGQVSMPVLGVLGGQYTPPVPEPATLPLTAAGLAMLAWRRRGPGATRRAPGAQAGAA